MKPTTPTTPKLSEVARHLTIPSGIVTSVFPRVERRLRTVGVEFDPWQVGLSSASLGCRAGGRYAATVGGITWSIPRQVGKTFTVGNLLIGLALEFPNTKIVWTSHHNRTTTNTFRSMQSMVRRPKVLPLLASNGIRTANGEQEIRFANGSIIMFGAREFGFGRGMDAIDFMVFDEAQILGLKALEDMVPATNQAKHPHGALIFFIGTPPRPSDNGEAFTAKREAGIANKDDNALYVELSADPDADPDDRVQWRKANPSFPGRTPLESMLRMRANLPSDEAWLREALGVWVRAASGGVIPFDAWMDRADQKSEGVGPVVLGVEVGPDLAWASISLGAQRGDGLWHVELVEGRNGAAWMPARLHQLVETNPNVVGVVVDVGGPIKAMSHQRGQRFFLDGPNVPLTALRVNELAVACTKLLDGAVTGWLRHIDQPQLNAAVQAAGKRMMGDTGTWTFSRKSTASDITAVQAATYALWGSQNVGKVVSSRVTVTSLGGRRGATRSYKKRGEA